MQCQEVSESIDRRNREIIMESERYAEIKKFINNNRRILEDKKIRL